MRLPSHTQPALPLHTLHPRQDGRKQGRKSAQKKRSQRLKNLCLSPSSADPYPTHCLTPSLTDRTHTTGAHTMKEANKDRQVGLLSPPRRSIKDIQCTSHQWAWQCPKKTARGGQSSRESGQLCVLSLSCVSTMR
mmetsp:Transcript_45563/g.113163  ORF Transcript_45563/g.113163 Transcript_45563/m.113163 type:complete len:135 (-) Transcript_45563:55-459(-)